MCSSVLRCRDRFGRVVPLREIDRDADQEGATGHHERPPYDIPGVAGVPRVVDEGDRAVIQEDQALLKTRPLPKAERASAYGPPAAGSERMPTPMMLPMISAADWGGVLSWAMVPSGLTRTSCIRWSGQGWSLSSQRRTGDYRVLHAAVVVALAKATTRTGRRGVPACPALLVRVSLTSQP